MSFNLSAGGADEGNGGTSYLRNTGGRVGNGFEGLRSWECCGGGPGGLGGIRESIELLVGPRLGLGISIRGTASMLTRGEVRRLYVWSDDGGGLGGR